MLLMERKGSQWGSVDKSFKYLKILYGGAEIIVIQTADLNSHHTGHVLVVILESSSSSPAKGGRTLLPTKCYTYGRHDDHAENEDEHADLAMDDDASRFL